MMDLKEGRSAHPPTRSSHATSALFRELTPVVRAGPRSADVGGTATKYGRT